MFALRFALGFLGKGMFNLGMTLLIEITGTEYRMYLGILVNVSNADMHSRSKNFHNECSDEIKLFWSIVNSRKTNKTYFPLCLPDPICNWWDGGWLGGLPLPGLAGLFVGLECGDVACPFHMAFHARVSTLAGFQGKDGRGKGGSQKGGQDEWEGKGLSRGPQRQWTDWTCENKKKSMLLLKIVIISPKKQFFVCFYGPWSTIKVACLFSLLGLMCFAINNFRFILQDQAKLGFRFLFSDSTVSLITLVQWANWVVVSMAYYGLGFTSVNLSSDPYISFVLSALIEIPSYLFCLCVLDGIGRKPTTVFSMMLAGVCCLVSA